MIDAARTFLTLGKHIALDLIENGKIISSVWTGTSLLFTSYMKLTPLQTFIMIKGDLVERGDVSRYCCEPLDIQIAENLFPNIKQH